MWRSPPLYDFILWIDPKLAHRPKVHRFTLGDRIIMVLMGVLDGLILTRYDPGGRVQELRPGEPGPRATGLP